MSGQNIVWSEALKKHNQVVSVRLEPKTGGSPFYVSTYHMPCNFRMPGVMLIHSVLLVQHVQDIIMSYQQSLNSKLHVDIPSIICGDFNFKPDSLMYNIITNNKYSENSQLTSLMANSKINLRKEDITDLFKVGVPLELENSSLVSTESNNSNINISIDKFDWTIKSTECKGGSSLYDSVYRSKLGSEPDFTNYAMTRAGGSNLNTSKYSSEPVVNLPFIDTLDYIFVSSPHWNVECVKALPHRLDVLSEAGVDMTALPDEKDLVALSSLYNSTGNVMSFPTATEPSDHIMLSASLSLK